MPLISEVHFQEVRVERSQMQQRLVATSVVRPFSRVWGIKIQVPTPGPDRVFQMSRELDTNLPEYLATQEDRQLYSKVIASLPTEDDLALIAVKPTQDWIAEKERKKRK